jgi:hypothetical protein
MMGLPESESVDVFLNASFLYQTTPHFNFPGACVHRNIKRWPPERAAVTLEMPYPPNT